MQVWAITGGIACGKSAVAALFAACGAQVGSADADARAVLAEPEVVAALAAAFPEAVSVEGGVDRTALGASIFADAAARANLNGIMHPAIRRRMRAAIDAARANPAQGLLLYEVPLLYEGGLETWFDGVIVVAASAAVQRERLSVRAPLTDAELDQRLAAQMPVDEKVRRADLVVRTDVPMAQTRAEVERLAVERFGLRSAPA